MYKYLILLLFIYSCDIINPEEPIPSYIEISNFDLNTNHNQGSNSENIQDVWVYLNDNLQGIYETPATFPVIQEGFHKIELKAGIKRNGISASRSYYPFYTSYILDSIQLTTDSIISITPDITYNISTIPFIEDFENTGINLTSSGNSDTTIITKNDIMSLEGNYGLAQLNENQNIFECSTYENFVFSNSQNVYIELDYKSDVQFAVGLYINTPLEIIQEPFIYINPKESWNKIYIDLSQQINLYSNAISFNIWIGFTSAEQKIKNLLIDNFKVVYNE